jgi:hypothetical protein
MSDPSSGLLPLNPLAPHYAGESDNTRITAPACYVAATVSADAHLAVGKDDEQERRSRLLSATKPAVSGTLLRPAAHCALG